MRRKGLVAKLVFAFVLVMLLGFGQTALANEMEVDVQERISDLEALITEYERQGDLDHQLVQQLTNKLDQVSHHLEKGSTQQSAKMLKDFHDHLKLGGEQSWITETAMEDLDPRVNDLIETLESIVVLVAEGQSQAAIVLATESSELEQQAANELQDYIKKISGAELPILISNNVTDVEGLKIYIGGAADGTNTDAILAGGDDPASFQLLVTEESVKLTGLSDEGTLYAAYELLEQLGIRWIMPGEIGTVVPSSELVLISMQDTIQHPGFSTRRLQHIMTSAAEWSQHNRLGGVDYGRHGFPCSISNQERPDLFMQENGQPTRQFDVSKPEVLECVVEGALAELEKDPNLNYISMGPRDGGGFGESEWDADDFDPLQGAISRTDRYIKFYNKVIEELEKEGYDHVGIATYIYSGYLRPPVREIPNPKILPIFAPITIERLHSIDNPLSWERQYLKDVYDGWAELGLDLMYRGYLFNLADPGLPFSMIDQVESEFKYYYDNGFERMRVESGSDWGYYGPSLYLASKMMWNPELDVQAVLDDYFSKFYGSAADFMQAHFERLEKAFIEADFFAGSINDFKHILTPETLQELEQSLIQAEEEAELSDDPVYAKRVNMVRIAFDYGKNFMEMERAFNQFDFIKAKELYDVVSGIAAEALAHEPNVIRPGSWSYAGRFYESMITQGYERVTNGNRIVAELPDEWHVMLDPMGGGAQLGLWKPTLGTESWMKLKTYSRSWSAQGLRYYKGDAWYRTTVDVPAEFEDKDIRLWISSLDRAARVWINGKPLPITKEGRAIGIPWEFDASEAIIAGEPNVIVVDITKTGLAELGTGGIMGPVMLYELENIPTPPLLADPGFEKPGTPGWNLRDGNLDQNVVYSGNYSASLLYESNISFNAISSSAIEVEPGEKYHLSGWIKNDTTQGNASLGVRYADASNSTIRYDLQAADQASDWTFYEMDLEVPENAVSMSVYFTLNSNANGNAWLDDVELIKVSKE